MSLRAVMVSAMTLIRRPNKPIRPPCGWRRQRAAGEIRGKLEALKPFVFICTAGMTWEIPDAASIQAGRYTVCEAEGNGLFPRQGVILPASLCDELVMREALDALRPLVMVPEPDLDVARRRAQVQAILDRAFDGKLVLEPVTSLDGFVALQRSSGLFETLTAHFRYLTLIDDNPETGAWPLEWQAFRWPGYGQFMEWLYSAPHAGGWQGSWRHCDAYLVYDQTGVLGDSWRISDTSALSQPAFPSMRPLRVAPDVNNTPVHVQFSMGHHGWAHLTIALGDAECRIRLSDVFPPFENILSWTRAVARGDLPMQVDIDEEGTEKSLIVLDLYSADRVLFAVKDRWNSDLFLEAVVSRTDLVTQFRNGLREFFLHEFDPEHWRTARNSYDEPIPDTRFKTRMLADPWLFPERRTK